MSGELEPRDPESGDLLRICASLNRVGARYVVIGGMAMVLHGFNRGTEDIDLLVDRTIENIARLREALSILPDNAVREVRDTDVEEYGVVRVADEVVVDLMALTNKPLVSVEIRDSISSLGRVNTNFPCASVR